MTVGELLEALQGVSPEMLVIVDDGQYRLLEPERASVQAIEKIAKDFYRLDGSDEIGLAFVLE